MVFKDKIVQSSCWEWCPHSTKMAGIPFPRDFSSRVKDNCKAVQTANSRDSSILTACKPILANLNKNVNKPLPGGARSKAFEASFQGIALQRTIPKAELAVSFEAAHS